MTIFGNISQFDEVQMKILILKTFEIFEQLN